MHFLHIIKIKSYINVYISDNSLINYHINYLIYNYSYNKINLSNKISI